MQQLVSTEWLAGELGRKDLLLLDATYYALHPDRDARQEYESAHIPGAIFMNLGQIYDTADPRPFMLPSAEAFAAAMRALGYSDGMRIVLYDNTPYHSSARAWWMCRHFGIRNVAVLDGNLDLWKAQGRPVEAGWVTPAPGNFDAAVPDDSVRTADDVLRTVESGGAVLVDARGAARFTGAEGDPRPGVAPGHIPGSRNLPYGQLFDADGRWKDADGIRAAFASAGVDLSQPVITTCGSGLTAAILLFAAGLLGKDDVALYDGSWSEWGARPEFPKAMGTA